MRNTSIRIYVYLLLLILTIGTISSAADHKIIENEKTMNTNQLEYEYYNYQGMIDLLSDLVTIYPDIMSYASLGTTYEGRDLWMVKLSDNVEENEDEPGVLLMGAHHGNEKPGYESLIFFINHMLENYVKENTDDDGDGQMNEDIIDGVDNDDDGLVDEDPSEDRAREVIDNTEIFIIPMVNPDGVEYKSGQNDGWRKNRAPKEGQTAGSIGVDLNRNYGFKWELYDIFPAAYFDAYMSDPTSWNYRGEGPFSEQETTAVKNFVESEDIKISISYHSYGEFITYPWTHTSGITPHEAQYVSIGTGITDINGYYLYSGSSTIIPWPGGTIGTSENWLYGEQNIMSFVIELCETRAPTNPTVVYDYCLTHVGVNLYACEKAPQISLSKSATYWPFPFMRIFSFLQNLVPQ